MARGVRLKCAVPSRTTIACRARRRMSRVISSRASERVIPPTSTPPTVTPSAILSLFIWSYAVTPPTPSNTTASSEAMMMKERERTRTETGGL